MGLFGFGKKKETKNCDCGGACAPIEKATECDCGGACAPIEKTTECDCGGACAPAAAKEGSCCDNIDANSIANAKEAMENGASVKVLGSGCKKCDDLESATKEALASLNMDTTIEHVRDFSAIASYGVMTTPALVVDGKVVSYGKVLKSSEVIEILKKVRS